MNFERYSEKHFKDLTKSNYWAAKFAWEACRGEIINLIKENSYPLNKYDEYAIELVKKIEKL